ncbi:MAG: hypothetical protein ACR2G2_19380 [Pseudonocardia sp.]
MTATSAPLIRFVTEGLTATIDTHLAGTLPLHRFAWELSTRVDMLAALDPPARTLTRLRWLQRTVELLHATLSARVRTTGRGELTGDEENTLTVTVADLRTVLATLTPRNPLDPAGAARPARLLAAVG